MKIQYLGHSSFKMVSDGGTTVITDPYPPEVGYLMPRLAADGVTVSHGHYDHSYTDGVAGNPQIFSSQGDFKLGGFAISSFPSFHDNARGAMRGENLIFRFTADGITAFHLGDLGESFTQSRANTFAGADVLMIPVGGNYTVDAKAAMEYIKASRPGIVLPMHYMCEGCKIDISPLKGFLELAKEAGLDVSEAAALHPEAAGGKTRVVILRKLK